MTFALIYSNWAFRSGCFEPSFALRLDWRENPSFTNSLRTVSALIGCPISVRAAASLVGAAIMAAIAAYAVWKPESVFANIRSERESSTHPLADLKRLARHRPIYPALLMWLLWNFAPGSATPLQYHLQNTLHATDAQWGQWNAIFAASFIPTFIVYGF